MLIAWKAVKLRRIWENGFFPKLFHGYTILVNKELACLFCFLPENIACYMHFVFNTVLIILINTDNIDLTKLIYRIIFILKTNLSNFLASSTRQNKGNDNII